MYKIYAYFNYTEQQYYVMMVKGNDPVYALTATRENLDVKIDALIEEIVMDDERVKVYK